jgi:hypothetical protein
VSVSVSEAESAEVDGFLTSSLEHPVCVPTRMAVPSTIMVTLFFIVGLLFSG